MARFESMGSEYAGLANPDNVQNIFEMGLKYASGRNGEPDLVAAHKWFNIAAFRGFEAAKIQREELSAEMTREQIAAAQRAARNWLSSH